MTHIIKKTKEIIGKTKQELIEENAALSEINEEQHSDILEYWTEADVSAKALLEILLKEDGKTEQEVTEILESDTWRTETDFSVSSHFNINSEDYSYKSNYKINWKSNQKTPKEIIDMVDERKKRAEEQAKELEEKELRIKDLEVKVEELAERVEIELETNLEALDKAEEWHDRRVFVENMKRDCTIIEQRIENDQLRKKLDFYEKKDKIKQVKKLANKFKIKTRNKVDIAKEKFNVIKEGVKQKFNAYILQNNK